MKMSWEEKIYAKLEREKKNRHWWCIDDYGNFWVGTDSSAYNLGAFRRITPCKWLEIRKSFLSRYLEPYDDVDIHEEKIIEVGKVKAHYFGNKDNVVYVNDKFTKDFAKMTPKISPFYHPAMLYYFDNQGNIKGFICGMRV